MSAQMRTKWGIITDGGKSYIADPTGKTQAMAWTYDREDAEKTAAAVGGEVVDVEAFAKAFNEMADGKEAKA